MMRQKEKKRKGELTGGMTPGRVTCFMRTNLPSLMGHVRLSWPAFSQISSRFCNSLMYPYFISTLTYAPAPISAEVVPVAQIVRLWPLGGWGGLLASSSSSSSSSASSSCKKKKKKKISKNSRKRRVRVDIDTLNGQDIVLGLFAMPQRAVPWHRRSRRRLLLLLRHSASPEQRRLAAP